MIFEVPLDYSTALITCCCRCCFCCGRCFSLRRLHCTHHLPPTLPLLIVLPPPTALSAFAGTADASAYHSTANDTLITCRSCCRFSLADDAALIICCCCCRFRLSLHRQCHHHCHTLYLFVCHRRRRCCCCCSHHFPPPLSTPPLFHRLPLPPPLCFRNDEGNGRRIRNKSVNRVVTRPTAF